MCIILDTNMFYKFKNLDDEDMKPVWDWLNEQNGKIVYTSTKKIEEEWERGGMTDLIKLLTQSGQLKDISSQEVEQKKRELNQTGEVKSNDLYTIALAMVAGVKILLSEDKTLHEDFKNRKLVGGKVYQTRDHSRLLRGYTCPQ